jgi:hypothetical protein
MRLMNILEKNNPKPRPKILGLFLGLSQCTTSVPPVAWAQAVSQADDIFGVEANTLV